ncbi:MAG: TauD/TfdA family dioxygenase [Rhodovibrionaceae bacterium]
MALAVQPSGAALGAVVEGLDLTKPLSDEIFEEILAAFHCHHVLCFRDQDLDEESFIAFSRRFGELQTHVLSQWLRDDYPEIYILSNYDMAGSGKPTGGDKVARVWHSDLSFAEVPALATLLYAVEVPSEGGNTEFANMLAAHDALDERSKRRLEKLRAIHDLQTSHNRIKQKPLTEEQIKAAPPVEHPIVRTHTPTGRKGLYMGYGHTKGVVGMSEKEGQVLIDELVAFSTEPRFVYSHKWCVGDVVLWDNRCTMHRGTPYDDRERRRMLRTTVKGTEIPA